MEVDPLLPVIVSRCLLLLLWLFVVAWRVSARIPLLPLDPPTTFARQQCIHFERRYAVEVAGNGMFEA